MDDARLKALLDSGPHDPETRRQIGAALMDRRRWSVARLVLDAAVRVSPSDNKALALLARATLYDGDPEGAARLIASMPKPARRSKSLWRMRVVALERSGELGKAEVQARGYLARRGNDATVEAILNRIVELKPVVFGVVAALDPHVSVRRAQAYARRGDLDRAVRTLRRVLYHRPDAAVAEQLARWERALTERRRASLAGVSSGE